MRLITRRELWFGEVLDRSSSYAGGVKLEQELRRIARSVDLVAIGFCSADPFPEVEQSLRRAVESGRSGSLGFTFRDPTTASDPSASFPWAESLVVVGHSYLAGVGR